MTVSKAPLGFAPIMAAVLAGGLATRLDGHDKGLQLLAGEPLIHWVLRRIRSQVHTIVICANRNADAYAAYAPVLADATKGFLGPLAGICTSLDAIQDEWLLTVPVDSPMPPFDLAQRLLEACVVAKTLAAFVHDGERRQPLFALYHHSVKASAHLALAQNLGVWQWQDTLHAGCVDFSDQTSAFVNLNTPQDFRDFESDRHDR